MLHFWRVLNSANVCIFLLSVLCRETKENVEMDRSASAERKILLYSTVLVLAQVVELVQNANDVARTCTGRRAVETLLLILFIMMTFVETPPKY